VQDASDYNAPRRCAVCFAVCWTCAASWYKVESNVSLWLADIPRNQKISKHTGETNHIHNFDNALKAVVAAMRPAWLVWIISKCLY